MTTTSARRGIASVAAAMLTLVAVFLGASPANAAETPPTIVPGAPAGASGFVEYNGLMYLSGVAETDIYGSLFTFDGTTFASVPGSPHGINNLTVFNGHLIVTAVDDITSAPFDYVMYSFDGTTFTPVPGAFVSPNTYVEASGVLFFLADQAGSWGLWQYDGTATSPVPGADGTLNPENASEFEGKLYFAGYPGAESQLYVYDPASPGVDAALVPGSPTGLDVLVTLDGVAYLAADGLLYSFDGTTFTNLPLDPMVQPFSLTAFDGKIFFGGVNADGYHPYSYSAGVTTTILGGVSTETSHFAEYNGRLYFSGWTDGTPTLVVIEASAAALVAAAPGYPFSLYVFEGKLYFVGDDAEGASAMYVLETEPFAPTPEPVPGPDPAALAPTGSEPWAPAAVALALLALGATALLATRRLASQS